MSLYKIARVAGLVGVSAILVGCATSPIPTAENFELTTQKKVRSAGHWELLARDVIAQTSTSLERAGIGAGTDMHVALPNNASEFDRAFRDFLITELVENGKSVMVKPEGAIEVSYETQVVRHRSERPHFVPGRYSMLTAGLYAIYGISREHLDVQLLGGLALAGLADYAASVYTGGPTHTEMILTTTVSSGGRYLARKTDVYYLENDDAFLFARSSLRPVVMEVVAQ